MRSPGTAAGEITYTIGMSRNFQDHRNALMNAFITPELASDVVAWHISNTD